MKKLFFIALSALFSLQTVGAQTVNPLWLRDVQLSPDGQQILFCYKGDIYKVPATGGNTVRLTTQDSYECSPVWSKDGKKVAFASDRHGNMDVFVMSAEGGSAKRLTYNSAEEIPQSFSPDDKDIYFGATIQDPSSSAMFPSSRLPELYKVPADGGRTEQVLGTPAEMLSFANDGKGFYYQDRKGYEDEWRKHHTSSITRDIWFYDTQSGKHTNLTLHAGEDRNPVAGEDGTLFFLSERDGGSMNVYAMENPSVGAEIKKVSSFITHPVRFLSEAAGLLCYTYNGEIYTQRPGGDAKKVDISLTRDDESQLADLTFTSGANDATVSRDGKEVAFVVRGDVFVTSTEYRTTKQISNTAGAEKGVDFAPDGRSLVYASERDGNWQLYIAKIGRDEDPNFSNATIIKEEMLIPSSDIERCWPKFSPDGKKVAFIEDRIKLKVVDLATNIVSEVTDGSKWYDQEGQFEFEWSPDGNWFVLNFIAHQRDPYMDQGIVSVNGGEIHPITESGYMSSSPRWVMDGKAILFESERYGMRSHASWGSQDDVFMAFLTQDAYDEYRLSEEDYALQKEVKEKNKKKEEEAAKGKKKKNSKKDKTTDSSNEDDKDKVKPIEIQFDGLADRIVRLTPNSSRLGQAIIDKDGENLYYYSAFESGYDLWKMNLRKHETSLLDKTDSSDPVLTMDKDGNIYSLGSDKMVKVDAKSGKRTPIVYSAKMRLDLQAEREYMYNHVAKQIEKKIFRTDYNGCDWQMMVENYRQFLPHIANNYDYAELLSEILGELNVSHTGGRYYARPDNADATAQLGLFLEAQKGQTGYKVTDIIAGGPFDRADSKLKVGDVITSINGKELTADTDIAQLMNLQAGKKTLVGFTGGEEVVLPISNSRQHALIYERWVKSRRAAVDSLSHGRLGYVHIEGMNDRSFRSVYSDILGKYNQKEGIVIDTRNNGGGRLHEDIEILFSGEHYFTQVIRGREVCDMPSRRYNHPSIMIQAEGNYSNAHGTPWVYSHKKIGKLVGAPVPGTMSSVNWETLQDRSLVFGVPVIGYQLPDGSYLENTQLEPDIYVLNRPETVVKGVDLQLEAAVKELLKEIDAK